MSYSDYPYSSASSGYGSYQQPYESRSYSSSDQYGQYSYTSSSSQPLDQYAQPPGTTDYTGYSSTTGTGYSSAPATGYTSTSAGYSSTPATSYLSPATGYTTSGTAYTSPAVDYTSATGYTSPAVDYTTATGYTSSAAIDYTSSTATGYTSSAAVDYTSPPATAYSDSTSSYASYQYSQDTAKVNSFASYSSAPTDTTSEAFSTAHYVSTAPQNETPIQPASSFDSYQYQSSNYSQNSRPYEQNSAASGYGGSYRRDEPAYQEDQSQPANTWTSSDHYNPYSPDYYQQSPATTDYIQKEETGTGNLDYSVPLETYSVDKNIIESGVVGSSMGGSSAIGLGNSSAIGVGSGFSQTAINSNADSYQSSVKPASNELNKPQYSFGGYSGPSQFNKGLENTVGNTPRSYNNYDRTGPRNYGQTNYSGGQTEPKTVGVTSYSSDYYSSSRGRGAEHSNFQVGNEDSYQRVDSNSFSAGQDTTVPPAQTAIPERGYNSQRGGGSFSNYHGPSYRGGRSNFSRGTSFSNRGSFSTDRGSSFSAGASAFSNTQTFSSDRGTSYLDRGSSSDRGSSFSARGFATSDRGSSFSPREASTSDRGSTFSARGAFTSDTGSTFSARGASSSDRGSSFSARGASTSDRGSSFSARGASTSDRGSSFSARGASSSDRGSSFSARGASTSDRGSSFSARGASSSDRGSSFSARGASSSDRASFSARGASSSDRGSSFSPRGSSFSSRGASFSARGSSFSANHNDQCNTVSKPSVAPFDARNKINEVRNSNSAPGKPAVNIPPSSQNKTPFPESKPQDTVKKEAFKAPARETVKKEVFKAPARPQDRLLNEIEEKEKAQRAEELKKSVEAQKKTKEEQKKTEEEQKKAEEERLKALAEQKKLAEEELRKKVAEEAVKAAPPSKPPQTAEEIAHEEEIQRKIRESVVIISPEQELALLKDDPSKEFEMPEELRTLLKTLMTDYLCKLCSVRIAGPQMGTMHYNGKNHLKKLRNFVQTYGRSAGFNMDTLEKSKKEEPKEVTAGEKKAEIVEVTVIDEKQFCKICKVSFSQASQADMHYKGKNHAKRLKSGGTGNSPEAFECKICCVTVTAQEHLTAHLNGFRHKQQVRKMDANENYRGGMRGRGKGPGFPFRGRGGRGGGDIGGEDWKPPPLVNVRGRGGFRGRGPSGGDGLWRGQGFKRRGTFDDGFPHRSEFGAPFFKRPRF